MYSSSSSSKWLVKPKLKFSIRAYTQYQILSFRHETCGVTAVAQWLQLCYKSEGRWFDPSWCQGIFHWHKILPIALWPWGWLSLEQKWVPGELPGGKSGRCVRLTTYHHPVPLSQNLGTLTSWHPLGLSRPVMGLILHETCQGQGQYGYCGVILCTPAMNENNM